MADKDDSNEIKPGSEGRPEEAAQSAGEGDLGLDLAAEPEFLALAADFDAAIKGGNHAGESDALEERLTEPHAPGTTDEPADETAPAEGRQDRATETAPPGESGADSSGDSSSDSSGDSSGDLSGDPAGEPTDEPSAAPSSWSSAQSPGGHSRSGLMPENGSPPPEDPDGPDFVLVTEPVLPEPVRPEQALSKTLPHDATPEREAEETRKTNAAAPPDRTPPEASARPTLPPPDGIGANGPGADGLGADGEGARAGKTGFLRRGSEKRRAAAHPERPVKAPYLGVDSGPEPTVLSRLFNSLALGAVFVLTAVFLLQVVPGLQSGRLLWFSDELRQADVLAGVFNGDWLQIYLNGQLYQEAPPLYFWFLMGLHKLLLLGGADLGADYARLLYTGAAVSGLLLLWATYGLARSTAHLDRRGSFAAGCVLLSVLFLQFFFHYSSLDLFFAAFIVASHIFMYKALMRERAPLCMGLAFLCAAVALMSKGALGLALPVLSAVLFCLWRGRPRRLLRGDFLLGLVFALLPAVVWLGSIWAMGQHDLVLKMLREQIWIKAFGDAWHKGPWWYYLAVLPALWLPWSLALVTLPWHRLLSRTARAKLRSARSGERQGLAFVWLFFLGAFALISLLQHKQPVYLVPLMGPLAVLTGRAVLQLSPMRSTVLQRLMALFFFLLSVSFVLLPVYYSGNIPTFFSWLEKLDLPPWELKINGIFLLAVIMLATTCLLIGVVKARRPESTLLVLLLSATLFSFPLSTMTMPSLDAVVSSKAASVEIRRYADLGYYPVSFKVYDGVFSYYAGIIVNESDNWAEFDHIVAEHQKIIVAMSASRWKDWTRHPGFTEIMRFWMYSNEYVLLLRNAASPENGSGPTEPQRFAPGAQGQPEPLIEDEVNGKRPDADPIEVQPDARPVSPDMPGEPARNSGEDTVESPGNYLPDEGGDETGGDFVEDRGNMPGPEEGAVAEPGLDAPASGDLLDPPPREPLPNALAPDAPASPDFLSDDLQPSQGEPASARPAESADDGADEGGERPDDADLTGEAENPAAPAEEPATDDSRAPNGFSSDAPAQAEQSDASTSEVPEDVQAPVPDADAGVEHLPDGLPLSDAPEPHDPFSPVPLD